MLICCLLILVSIEDISERFHGEQVSIMGQVEEIGQRLGRLDSKFTQITLRSEDAPDTLTILTTAPFLYQVGSWVGITGKYQHTGWFAGYLWEKFIILKESWSLRGKEE